MCENRFLFFAVVCITVSCASISTQAYTINTPLLEEQSVIKIVLISDLHSTIFGKDQSVLIDMIKEIEPDLIFLTGDIIDDVVPVTGTRLLLSGISGMAPIYYVTGNHEYRSHNIQEIREELVSRRVIILSDSYVKVEINNNEIIIAGIDDPDKKRYETPAYNQDESMEEAFRELDNTPLFKILLAHRPERIEKYKRYSFDLVLSGHTHGGQVRFPPLINGLYAPHQGLFPKYAGGIYTHGNLTHVVSRGLSISPWFPRIFNPPELVVIVIESNK
jgi:predicted MPP superfamily phosphohydrolase